MIRIAVDAMGSDRGTAAVIEGARKPPPRHRPRHLRLGEPRHARARAPFDDPGRRDGREARQRRPHEGGQLARPAIRPLRTGTPTRSCRPATRERSRRGLVHLRRVPGVRRPAIAVPIPPGRARRCCSTPERTPTAVPSTCSSSRRWESSSRRRSSASRSRRCVSFRSARNPRRGISSRSRRTSCSPLPTSISGATRGSRRPRGRGRRPRRRRLHRQRRAQGRRGDDPDPARLPARRDQRHTAGTVGGLLIRPPPGGCASAWIPTRTEAPTSSACAASW